MTGDSRISTSGISVNPAVGEENGVALRLQFGELLDCKVLGMRQITGGRNSGVFRLDCDGSIYAGKVYFRDPKDTRDRLRAECEGLDFLRRNGVTCVPAVRACCPEQALAVFEYVEGRNIRDDELSKREIGFAVDFLGELAEVGKRPSAEALGPASEACFSPAEAEMAIRRRLQRLHSSNNQALASFLDVRFVPALEAVLAWCREKSEVLGVSYDQPLAREHLALSPSDFGFHNALMRPGGGFVFLDFEYFGWDDPSKLIADFLFHPGMKLSDDLKRCFVKGAARLYPGVGILNRLRSVYGLAGLKWCLILLNEFIPGGFERRGFAAGTALSQDEVLKRQLEKAEAMLTKVLEEYEGFPYA